jgi:hypothetical protein
VWFLVAGLYCISLGDARSLAPINMAGAYAVGMTLVAAIHYFSAKKAEVGDDEEQ